MTQTLQQRINYHPHPNEMDKSDRKVRERFDLILKKVSFKDKIVWDLGCSGGIFSFLVAKHAKKVIAIDGDRELIERNQSIQKELGLTNIEFIHATIRPDLIHSLPQADVVLFLSVYHHMLANSTVYGWNKNLNSDVLIEVIDALNNKTNTLVFEIGYPNEGYDWCAKLPNYGKNWDVYVKEHIFRDCYTTIEIERPQLHLSWYKKNIISRLNIPYREDPKIIQRIKNFLHYDPRDFRKIYFGFKS